MSSADTAGLGAVTTTALAAGGEVGGGPSEPPRQQGPLHRHGGRVGFGGLLQHPPEQANVESVGVGGVLAGGVTPIATRSLRRESTSFARSALVTLLPAALIDIGAVHPAAQTRL